MKDEMWMRAVDAAVIAKAGVSVYDLSDNLYADWFEDEMSPRKAANLALANEGY